jgi:hypothetical protein
VYNRSRALDLRSDQSQNENDLPQNDLPQKAFTQNAFTQNSSQNLFNFKHFHYSTNLTQHMSRHSELDAALALLEMAKGRGDLEQDLATENLREAETVDNCARFLTSSLKRSWADAMEESDAELGYILPSGATAPVNSESLPPVRHTHPTSVPSPLSKAWKEATIRDVAETSMQMNWSSDGVTQYTDDDPLSLDPSHAFEEDHEMTETDGTEASYYHALRKGISRITPLRQLVLLKSTVGKWREQGYIPNNYHDEDYYASFRNRIAEQILRRQRPAFYTC